MIPVVAEALGGLSCVFVAKDTLLNRLSSTIYQVE
jgi:hypothetical protein